MPKILAVELKSRPRHVMLDELVVVLDAFYSQKHSAERHRCDKEQHQRSALAELRSMNCERHREAARDQHGCVDGAERYIELVACDGERTRIPAAVHRVDHEQAAEKEDLGAQEDPHSE